MSSSLLPSGLAMPGDPEGLTMSAAASYSLSKDVTGLLAYYLEMVVRDKPDDVVEYLKRKIADDPFVKDDEGGEKKEA
eukprot:CAMPEP_0197549926 /NCGR_PEP_ID=MMETSP1320-20131121/3689_1 /TAXON_ID=91990 /ORGANISM="Bolidomonas sp., Strain RCC2347" /LENGTH=77 /DNA_ID=CAMNT_0043110219 /DNA_START=16 /DNA_END=249 /DNA_ORIENTATION=-